MEKGNDVVVRDAWESIIKPGIQATIVGGGSLVAYEAWIHNFSEVAVLLGIPCLLLLKRYFFNGLDISKLLFLLRGKNIPSNSIYNFETTSAVKTDEEEVEEELQPWENPNRIVPSTKITIYHESKLGPGPVWWYDLPIESEKMARLCFHLIYLNGRFSHNYLCDTKRNPKILTKENLKKVQHYLVNNFAAKWRNGDSQNGLVVLEDGLAMIQYYAKLYNNPLPHERKALRRYGKSGLRYQYRQGTDRVIGEEMPELEGVDVYSENN